MANYLERNLSTYQVMMMTKGKSDFTKVEVFYISYKGILH